MRSIIASIATYISSNTIFTSLMSVIAISATRVHAQEYDPCYEHKALCDCFSSLFNESFIPIDTVRTGSSVSNIFMYMNPELWLLSITCIFLVFSLIYSVAAEARFALKLHYFAVLIVVSTSSSVYISSFDSFIYDSFLDSFHYIRNDYNSIVEAVILCISMLILTFTYSYNKKIGIYFPEYYVIMLLRICSFCLFIHCNNLIFMYVPIEPQSIGSYILTSLNRYNRYSIEAGSKYFVIGSFPSIPILFGFSFPYGFSGLISFDDLSLYVRYLYSVEESFIFSSLLFPFIFFNIGFLFKIYASPFHFWVSDIYQGSPTSVTMFPSTIPVIAYIYVFIKLFICVFPDFFLFYSTIFYFFAILSMLSGVLGALIQKKLKRLIAYSPVSTIGYIIAGIFGDTVSSVQYCLFHLFVYIFNIIPIFIILLNYRVNDTNRVDHIRSFSNICYQNKWLYIFFVSIFSSLAGIPPFSGFLSKFYLFSPLGYNSLYSILFIGLITSISSCYYYLRIVKMVYYDSNSSYYFAGLSYQTCIACAYFFIFNSLFLISPFMVDDIRLYISLCLYMG